MWTDMHSPELCLPEKYLWKPARVVALRNVFEFRRIFLLDDWRNTQNFLLWEGINGDWLAFFSCRPIARIHFISHSLLAKIGNIVVVVVLAVVVVVANVVVVVAKKVVILLHGFISSHILLWSTEQAIKFIWILMQRLCRSVNYKVKNLFDLLAATSAECICSLPFSENSTPSMRTGWQDIICRMRFNSSSTQKKNREYKKR